MAVSGEKGKPLVARCDQGRHCQVVLLILFYHSYGNGANESVLGVVLLFWAGRIRYPAGFTMSDPILKRILCWGLGCCWRSEARAHDARARG